MALVDAVRPSGSSAPWQARLQAPQPVHADSCRVIRKTANLANTPSSAPSGQRARQKRRGTKRLATRMAISRPAASHPPGTGLPPGSAAHNPEARPRAASESGSSHPLCNVPSNAPTSTATRM